MINLQACHDDEAKSTHFSSYDGMRGCEDIFTMHVKA